MGEFLSLFLGHGQTNKQTNKQTKIIERSVLRPHKKLADTHQDENAQKDPDLASKVIGQSAKGN